MNLPAGTHLAYIVTDEAWYYDRTRWPGDLPHLSVSASAKGEGGGAAWEFQVNERELGGEQVTRVEMFYDAYAAFLQEPELFAALAEQQPRTLAEVRALLDSMGAVDETDRVNPYARQRASAPSTTLPPTHRYAGSNSDRQSTPRSRVRRRRCNSGHGDKD